MHVKTKTAYTKINRNSLGQFLRRLERFFWTSAFIRQEHSKDVTHPKTGVVTKITVPASVLKPGITYTKPEEEVA